MKCNAEDITSFLTFRHPLSVLKDYQYSYSMEYNCNDIEFEHMKTEARTLFSNAVSNEMEKFDKPAVMMSGGVDSVFLAVLMKRLNPDKKIKTYTAKFDGDTESIRAMEVAKHFHLSNTIIEIEPNDYLDLDRYLNPLIRLKKEPLHPNEIALAKTESKAKEDGCDVVFSGEGADDVFGGYSKLLTLYKTGNDLNQLLDFYRYFSLNKREQIINPEFLVDDVKMLDKIIGTKFYSIDNKNRMFYFIQRIHTPGLLKRGVNASRLSNLDCIFPYVEKNLVSYVNNLPFKYKISDTISKFILREIAMEYLPHEYAYASKHPFPVPFDSWMKNIGNWNLSRELFCSNNISTFSGWEKWMLINLNNWWMIKNEE